MGFSLPLRFSERRLLLTAIDLFCLAGGLLLAILIAYHLETYGARQVVSQTIELFAWQRGGSPLIWLGLLVTLWLPVASAFGLYEHSLPYDHKRNILSSLKASLVTLTVFILIPYANPFIHSRSVLFALFLSTILVMLLGRSVSYVFLRHTRFTHRTLIVGAGWAGRTLLGALRAQTEYGYQILGFVDDDPEKLGRPVKAADNTCSLENGPTVLTNRHHLKELVVNERISTVVLAVTNEVDAELTQILLDCLEYGVEIVPMPVLYEQITGRVPVEHVGENWYVSMPIAPRTASPLYNLVKRVMDLALSSLGLLCLAPFTPLIALAIYIDSPGPVFYAQERLGRRGERFRSWKFRSMVPDAEHGKPVWARRNDPRITRFGKWLRKTHLDEFPQLWNVLKGDMSAVGPRPERPEFVEVLEKSVPFYRTRLMVKPGMAGWGLVQQGYGASVEDALIKLQYDLYYIKHQSIYLDSVILLKTLMDTFRFRGR